MCTVNDGTTGTKTAHDVSLLTGCRKHPLVPDWAPVSFVVSSTLNWSQESDLAGSGDVNKPEGETCRLFRLYVIAHS